MLLLGILIMFSQLSIESYGCNTKILDSEAEAWVSKTWSKASFNEKQIKESLIFLDTSKDYSTTYKRYLDSSEFAKLCDKIYDQRLYPFLDLCRNIYSEDNITNKIDKFFNFTSYLQFLVEE